MNVIITGSRKGIGLEMAKKFLEFGDNVVISSRSADKIKELVHELREIYSDVNIFGFPCDVTHYDQVEPLAHFSKENLGSIDVWINNAGTNAYEINDLVDFSVEGLESVIKTNLLGTLFGCKAALKIMIEQGHGHIFNMEGMGSNGMKSPQLAAYGASKAALPQLTKSLVKETKDLNVGIHRISPGIVLTDLTLRNLSPESAKIFNILAEKPKTVIEYLVPRIRKVKGTDKHINFLSPPKIIWRFLTAFKRKNRFFDNNGNLLEE